MKMDLGLIVLAILVSTLSSCATASIETNKDAANLRPLEKVYVLVNTGDVKIAFTQSSDNSVAAFLRDNIEKGLAQRSIEVKAARIGGLELGEESIKRDIADFGALTLMTVNLDEGVVDTYHLLWSGYITVSVVDIPLDKTVWKAKIQLQRGMVAVSEATMNNVVAKIFAALSTDHLLKQ